MKERIQKVLANAGVASRRAIEEMVQQGRVSVNGRVVTELPILIDPESDRVAIDDETVKLKGKSSEHRVYLVMNKPKGVYSTNVAQGEQTRAIDLLPPDFPARVYPVGRLDAESKGLLLLTNDGELTNQLTHPRYGIPKTYRAMVDGFVKNELVDEMARGVWLADPKTGKGFKTGRTHVRIVKRSRDKSQLELTLREGRNRQVRRMLARLGHKVRDLTRIKMGPLTLQGLGPGEFRPLTRREVRELREMAQSRAKRHDEQKGEQRDGEREQRGSGRRKPRDRDQKH
jgi:23S rRNA pseudouridine2605 synthase